MNSNTSPLNSELAGQVAVVTGGGRGIGRALARQLAQAGSALAPADIGAEGLEQTAPSLSERGIQLSTHVVGVSSESAVQAFTGDVAAQHGRVTLLINNASVALHASLLVRYHRQAHLVVAVTELR